MASSAWFVVAVGAAIRFWLMSSSLAPYIRNSVEVSTPMNSWKRVTEGIFLYNRGIDPYSGNVVRETPICLLFFGYMFQNWKTFLPALFVVCDILTAVILSRTAKHFARDLLLKQSKEKKSYASDISTTTALLLRSADLQPVPFYVLVTYLFHPYSILNCVGMTTTVFSNLFLALTVLFSIKGQRVLATLAVALATYQAFYPLMLIVPISMYIAQKEGSLDSYVTMKPWVSFGKSLICFLVWCTMLLYVSYKICSNWNFLNAIYGCILLVPDLGPNIGLFWYFFTEMFEHFRLFFICCFQINVFIHLLPLAGRLRRQPMLLFFCLCGLMAMFKSYPCVGDVAFYTSLLPMWLYLYRYMRQSFIAGSFFLACSVLGPITRYLWLHAGSANANFYFGITLAFASGQTCLLTDVLFSSIKRDFHLVKGVKLAEVDGKAARISLL